jgi:hypothetical protein
MPGYKISNLCDHNRETALAGLNNLVFPKEPIYVPLYHSGPQYSGKEGDRINDDHHLTLEEKRKAREEAGHE